MIAIRVCLVILRFVPLILSLEMFQCLRLDFEGLTHPRPEASNRRKMLAQGAALLHKSDDSAYSIVPSRTSYRAKERISRASFESTEFTYRKLNIDNDLFTSGVHKRNYRPLGTVPQIRNRNLSEEGSLDSISLSPRATIRKQVEGTCIAKQRSHLAEFVSHDGRRGQQSFLDEGSAGTDTSLYDDEESRATRNRFSRKHPGFRQPCIPTVYQDHRTMEETYSASDSPRIKDSPFARSGSAAQMIQGEPDYATSVSGRVADSRQKVSAGSNDFIHDDLHPTNPEDNEIDASSETVANILASYRRDSNISTIAANAFAELEANSIKWIVQLSRIPYATASNVSHDFLVNGPALPHDLQLILGRPGSSGNHDIWYCVTRSKEEHLKRLLLHQPAEFADWRKYYFLEACLQGKANLVQTLFEYGVDIDLEYRGLTGPSLAARRGYIHVVEPILSWAANNNINIIKRHTLPHDAAVSANEALIELLVSKGAKVDQRGQDGTQPIHLACMSGHLNSIKRLLVLGARIDCMDFKGREPLHFLGHPNSRSHQDISAILHLLIVVGADPNSKTGDAENNSTLHVRPGKPIL